MPTKVPAKTSRKSADSLAMEQSNTIPLDSNLADEIRGNFDNLREHRFKVCSIASTVRNEYMDEKGQYPQVFRDWYKENKLDELFGKDSNFTKYASAGDVITYVKTKSNAEKYLKQLPHSIGALYEASQILKYDLRLFNACLVTTLTRTSLDQTISDCKSNTPALLNPQATEAKIKLWRLRWKNPPPPKQARTDKRTLAFVTITCSGELYDFHRKTGDKIGCLDLPEVEALLEKIQALITPEMELQFKITDNMENLMIGYTKRKDYNDPAKNILNKKPTKQKYKD